MIAPPNFIAGSGHTCCGFVWGSAESGPGNGEHETDEGRKNENSPRDYVRYALLPLLIIDIVKGAGA